MKDDELQDFIEKGSDVNSSDGKAYRAVFKALQKETDFAISNRVEDKIMNIVLVRSARKASKADVRWLTFGVVATIVCMLISLFSLPNFANQMVNALNGPMSLVGFALVMIGLLHWVEKLLRSKQNTTA